MATPKKKISRSRRDMRRYSCAHELNPVTWTKDGETGELKRPHTVTLATVDAYIAARDQRKAARKKEASPAS